MPATYTALGHPLPGKMEFQARTGSQAMIFARGAFSGGWEINNPLQYSCLENSMNREAWCAAVHGIEKSQA